MICFSFCFFVFVCLFVCLFTWPNVNFCLFPVQLVPKSKPKKEKSPGKVEGECLTNGAATSEAAKKPSGTERQKRTPKVDDDKEQERHLRYDIQII